MSADHWRLFAYDIRCPRRLSRVHRFLLKHGIAVQKSVFVIKYSQARLEALLTEMAPLIDAKLDDIRVYPIQHPSQLWLAGAIDTTLAAFNLPHPEPEPAAQSHRGGWLRRWLSKLVHRKWTR